LALSFFIGNPNESLIGIGVFFGEIFDFSEMFTGVFAFVLLPFCITIFITPFITPMQKNNDTTIILVIDKTALRLNFVILVWGNFISLIIYINILTKNEIFFCFVWFILDSTESLWCVYKFSFLVWTCMLDKNTPILMLQGAFWYHKIYLALYNVSNLFHLCRFRWTYSLLMIVYPLKW